MSDIFKEVDEEFQRDRVAMFFKRYSNLLIGLLLLVVAGVGGYRIYTYLETKKAAETGKAFEAALALDAEGKTAEAKAAFGELAKSAPAGYAALIKFRSASDLSKTDKAGAITAFDALANDAALDAQLRSLAQLRAGLLMVDTAPFAEVQKRLEPMAARGQTFRMSAREALAAAALKAGDAKKAETYLNETLGDAEATRAFRERAEIMMSLVRSAAPTQ